MKKILIVSALMIPVLVTSAFGAKTTELKFGHYSVESHAAHKAALMFAEGVEKRTNGAVTIKIYPNSKLGNSQEMMEQVRRGALDLVIPTEPALAKYVPKFNLITGPFAFKDYAQTDKFFNADFQKWVKKDLEKVGFTYLAKWEWGFRNYTNSKKRILTPADFKGMKFRTPPDFVNSETVKALGGVAQTIAFSELPMALKQGVVDGQENPIGVIHDFKMYETQKYLSILNYTYNGTHLIIGSKAYKKLSKDQQKIVMEEGVKAGKYMMDTVRKMEGQQIANLKKKGMVVDTPDTAPFKTAAAPVWNELKKKVKSSDYSQFQKLLSKATN